MTTSIVEDTEAPEDEMICPKPHNTLVAKLRFFFFFNKFIYLFIYLFFGCVGSSFLCEGFL